ncbi:MAG: DUF4340 domain-containing protein [Verrucomicrobia bacterium]|nr:DUF4340 domain-containing protein [Verrucomicrobiota bacterium]
MKRKNLWLLIAAAVLAAAVIVFYNFKRSAAWEGSGHELKVFPRLAVNEVTQIRITAPKAVLTVARKEDLWRVAERSNYPADFSKVRELLQTLWDLKAVREMQAGPSQFDRLQIALPGKGAGGGTQVELSDGTGKTVETLIIGKELGAQADDTAAAGPAGRFVYNPANKDHVYVVSELFANLQPLEVNQWLDKTFIAGGELDKVVRDSAPGNPGWAIARADNKAPWTFVPDLNGEKVKEETANLLSHFSPTFIDVRPGDAPATETGLDQPVRAELHTTDGFTYKLAIGKPGPDKTRYLAVQTDAQLPGARTADPKEKPEDKKAKDDEFNKHLAELKERLEREKKFASWIYEVPDYNLENLLKPRAELVAAKAPAPTPGPSAPETPAAPAPASAPAPAPATSSSPASPAVSPSPSPSSSPAATTSAP